MRKQATPKRPSLLVTGGLTKNIEQARTKTTNAALGSGRRGFFSTYAQLRSTPPPAEAENGQPRGAAELTRSLRGSGLFRESLVVADGRPGYNRVDWTGEFGCATPHRLNHRAGEIANEDGFTTNHIENLWSNITGATIVRRQRKSYFVGISGRCAIFAVFR